MLSVADAHVAYGSTPVLQGVSLTVQTGEIVSVIGRNGAGKTTLFKAIIGLLPWQRGTLTFNDADLTLLPAYARARRGLGYVPQGRMIFPNLTVMENLQVGADLNQSQQHDLLDEVLERSPSYESASASAVAPSPAANNKCSPSPAPWSATRNCYC